METTDEAAHSRSLLEYDLMKYKLANDALGIALWNMDILSANPFSTDNRFTWSQEFRRLLGFSGEHDFPNTIHSWSSRIHPEDKERALNAFAAHFNDHTGKTPYNIEYRLMMKNGNYRYFHAFGTTMRNSAGLPLKTAGALLDIDEKKQLQNQRMQTLQNMRNILNGIDAMIYATVPDTGEILFVNEHMKRHYGLKGSVIGQFCYKVFQVGLDEKCDLCPCYRLDNEPDSVVVWEEHSALTKRIYRNTDRYIDWIDGQKVHLQHSVDITDYLQAQQEIIESNEYNRFLYDNAPIGICTFDEKHRNFINFNDNLLNMLGVTKRDVCRSISDFSPEYQSDGMKSEDKAADIMNRLMGVDKLIFEWLYKSASGELIPCEVTIARTKYKGEHIVLSYVYDLRHARSMENKIRELAEKTYHDGLTGIYNRRYFDENLDRIIKFLSRSGGVISLILLDIDFFKKYNDTYGHREGDKCLKKVADALCGSLLRADDFAARYGGEEFAVVLPNTGVSGAELMAEKLLECVRGLNIPHEKNDAADCVTISIGLITGNVRDMKKADDYIVFADRMLYESKKRGRNRYTAGFFELEN